MELVFINSSQSIGTGISSYHVITGISGSIGSIGSISCGKTYPGFAKKLPDTLREYHVVVYIISLVLRSLCNDLLFIPYTADHPNSSKISHE